MIRLVLRSKGKIVPGWENDSERLLFGLAQAKVEPGASLHQQLEDAGVAISAGDAAGAVTLDYDGDAARAVQVVLELPDEAWDNLANWADDLLDQALLSDEEDD